MADNVELNAGTGGASLATDDVAGVHFQKVKIDVGGDGASAALGNANPLPVSDAGGSLTVDGTVAVSGTVTVNGSGVTQPVSDAGGSLTVDNAALAVVGGGVEASALRVTLASDSTGVLSVDDNGGALTVDGTVAATQSGAWNVGDISGTVSLPTGAATAAKQPALGTAGAASADVITVQGIASMTALQVADNGGSLTVDNGGTFAVQSAGAAAHDAAVSGSPVLGGAYASAAAPTDVSADGDAVRLWALRNGSQVVNLAAGGALIGATSNAIDVNIKSGAGSGGTAMTDDAAFTPATTSFTPVGGIVTADSVDSGDGGAFAMLANRQQKVTLYDSAGIELAVGGGTQYTEDAAAAADPVGNAIIVVRDDARSGSLTTADGDNVALRGTNAGELYVKHVDALTVNSHAVTNAGTFVTQENGAALTALQLIDNLVLAEDAAHGSGDPGVLMLAVRRDTAAVGSGTDGDNSTLNVNSSGRLYTSTTIDAAIPAGTNNIGDVDVLSVPADPFGANADAASATGSISAKLRFIAATGIPITGTVTVGSHAVTNAGTFATQVDGAALTALQLIDNASVADDAAFTPATTGVTVAGFFADETATDSVDEGDAGAARMTLDRKQIVTPYVHAAAGGATPYKNLDCDETEDDIKTSAGKLFWIHVMNRSTGVRYIKFYNATAANTTVGTTTPALSFPIPTMADTNGAGFCLNFGDMGVQFDTAICVAATTGVADNDTGAPGANDVVLNAGYI